MPHMTFANRHAIAPPREASLKIDHITFVARTLDQANDYAEKTFGVRLPPGGRHPLMGTHNLLTRIAPDVFLEFIAIDPDASPPDRHRWFALDRLARGGRLDESPALHAWVASVPGLTSTIPSRPEMETLVVTRGDLQWDFHLRRDGEAEAGGIFPALIDWGPAGSPVGRMPDVGIRLLGLQLGHPEIDAIFSRLHTTGWTAAEPANQFVHFGKADSPELLLELDTPRGPVRIAGGGL